MVITHVLVSSQVTVAGTSHEVPHTVDRGLATVASPKVAGIFQVTHVVHFAFEHPRSEREVNPGIMHVHLRQIFLFTVLLVFYFFQFR